MILTQLFTNPYAFFAFVIAVVIGVTIHEFSHALAAFIQGDPTAKNAGRLSLNPAKHFTLFGTIFLIFAGFGWGRPVPFNPYNLRNPKYGPFFVSLAGPFSNFVVVAVFASALKALLFYNIILPTSGLIILFGIIIIINIWLGVFNLIPIPPLDGATILFTILPRRYKNFEIFLMQYGIWILLGLLITNILGYILSIVASFILYFFGLSGIISNIL